MSEHISVRFKGSRWATTAHRATGRYIGDTERQSGSVGRHSPSSTATASEEDLLLNLAERHFANLHLTSREAHAFARALSRAANTGQTVSVGPLTNSMHTYEISRRIAAVSIRFGGDQMHLPKHAALQLAEALQRMHSEHEAEIAA